MRSLDFYLFNFETAAQSNGRCSRPAYLKLSSDLDFIRFHIITAVEEVIDQPPDLEDARNF
jgi:hypothetical protein